MAEGTLTVQTLNRTTGIVVTLAACTAGGDKFVNDGKTSIRVHNADASGHTVTVVSQELCSRGTEHDEPSAVSVGAGATREFGPFPKSRFNDANGYAHITYSAVTSMTVAAVEQPSG